MTTKLNNDKLDLIVHDLASACMTLMDKHIEGNDSVRAEYLGRALSEVLSVIICACPKAEIEQVTNSIVSQLRRSVAFSQALDSGLQMAMPEPTLKERVADSLYIAKKGEA